MTILEKIRGPRDLKALSEAELGELSEEIREFLVHAVARTGGHLGPNLGVDRAPLDRIVLDVQEGAVYVLWTSPRSFMLG
ncbi:1-deoxy-D-xylulose-5-phosphate synthase N-terminal domain-containing protein, partial [Streptomyces sp. NPDC005921]